MEEYEKISNDLLMFIEDNKQSFNAISICGFINCVHRLKVLHADLYERTNNIVKTSSEYVVKEVTDIKKEQSSMYRFVRKELKDIQQKLDQQKLNKKN